MKKFINILIILLLVFSCEKKQETYNGNIKLNYHEFLYFVKLKLNGRDANFLVDTGAASSVVDINQANKYKFKYSDTDLNFVGIGGIITRYRITDYKFMYDTTALKLYVLGADLKPVVQSFNSKGMNVVGILGSDFFRNNKAIIDYRNEIIILGE